MAVELLSGVKRRRHNLPRLWLIAALWILSSRAPFAAENVHKVFLRDVTQIEGIRENQLVGYGLVAGLNRTGDTQQTFFTVQTLANALTRMGVQIAPGVVLVKNIAAVFVTASLPPFARPGMKVDVTVSSVGDAKSITGGVLLLTALRAPNKDRSSSEGIPRVRAAIQERSITPRWAGSPREG
jgi:flagellar P-ring protein precursor FlgI